MIVLLFALDSEQMSPRKSERSLKTVSLLLLTEKQILKPNDVSVFSALSINGRLFACPREQLSSLVDVSSLFVEFENQVAVLCLHPTYK